MKSLSCLFLSLLLLGCSHKTPKTETTWISQSNQLAEEFTKAIAQRHPEIGSDIGLTEFDSHGVFINDKSEDEDIAFFNTWIERMNQQIQATPEGEFRTDLQILRGWMQKRKENIEVGLSAHEIDFEPGAKFVFQNLQRLLNSQTPAERKKASVERLHAYVAGDATHPPLLVAYQEEFHRKLAQYHGQKKFLPYREEVQQYLKDSASYLSGIEDLLKTSGREDWQGDFQTFKKQSAQYDRFSKGEALKNTRTDPKMPEAVYAQILKMRGIQRSPEDLVKTGQTDYKVLYEKFREQARIVAEKNHFSSSDPASVIQQLKANPVTDPAAAEELYRDADQRLEKIIAENNLVSLPPSPLKIRLASEAETKASPVPHLVAPPLINNHGERPEFIVPWSTKGLPFDDFASPYAAMVLTAHEGRPGHDLQFSGMLDHGLSVIRSRYAFNNVNVEGWALYAEDLVYPYLSPEEKLFALQTRLWRMARMFLDPQIQLGQIKDDRVIEVFTKELGVSKTMAGLELQRYKFDDPGQAPSYYEGYLLVKNMREEAEKQYGKSFNLKCFNDRVLSYGMQPLSMTAERMKVGPLCL